MNQQARPRWAHFIFIAAIAGAPVLCPAQENAPPDAAQDQSQAPPPQAESAATANPSAPANAQEQAQEPPGGKRVFGVLPNYRTADSSQEGVTLSASQKFRIATKDSFDWPLALLGGALAGLGQLTNQDPSFGQGVKGFAHRWVTNYADQAMGNMFTEGLFPVMLHQDPRYFRRATGTKWSRAGYALSRVFICDSDSGKRQFNYSEWFGNASAVAISNAYYPDNRTALDNVGKLFEQVGTDAVSQVLKEFWPDVKQKLFHRGTQ